MDTIDSFRGEYAFLSNFHPSPIEMDVARGVGLVSFPTGEHLFHSFRALFATEMSEPERGQWILTVSQATTANTAKRLGRQIKIDVDAWNDKSYDMMVWVQMLKFTHNPPLADLLLDTGDATLIEGNTWGDRVWGQVDGVGENRLGKILMQLREDIRRQRGQI